MTYLERALSLAVSAAEARHADVQRELTARAQVYALLAVAGSLAEIRDLMVLKHNEVAAHTRRNEL